MKKDRIHIENNTSHLTKTELLAYSRGELGIDEMYRLEQHIIDCKFCAEALEGMEQLPGKVNFDKVINSINDDVAPPNNINSRSWMMVAASVSLLLFASITFWLLRQETIPEQLALNTEQSTTQDTSEETQFSADEEKSDVIEEDGTFSESEADATEPVTAAEPIARSEVAVADLTVDAPREEPNLELEIAAVEDQEINEMELPVAVEENVQANVEITAVTREQTEDISRSKKSLAAPSATTPERELDSTTGRAAQGEPVYTNFIAPTPVGGNPALRRHIRKNIVYPPQAREKNIKGEVILQVTINSDGTIKAVVVSSSLGYGCDEEAIRLIESGPAWNPGLGDGNPVEATTEVNVKFRP